MTRTVEYKSGHSVDTLLYSKRSLRTQNSVHDPSLGNVIRRRLLCDALTTIRSARPPYTPYTPDVSIGHEARSVGTLPRSNSWGLGIPRLSLAACPF